MSTSLFHLEKRKLSHILIIVYSFLNQGSRAGGVDLLSPVTGREGIEQSCVRECSDWTLEGSSWRGWLLTAMISPGEGS